MPITVEMMKAAASSGLSVVCASCERYWEAREKKIAGDACLAMDGCGSPLAGDVFHEYRGPITEHVFKHNCFVCGDPAVKCLGVQHRQRVVGICQKHLEWLQDPEMRKPRPITLTTKKRNYLGVDEDTLKGFKLPPEDSLFGQILKTEKEWADEDGVEFDPTAPPLLGFGGGNGKGS